MTDEQRAPWGSITHTEERAPRGSLTPEEARLRKNERQREYAKKTGYAANRKYNASAMKRFVIDVNVNTEQDILMHLESIQNKSGYIKALIRKDIETD